MSVDTTPLQTSPEILPDDWATSLDNIVSSDLPALEEHFGYLKALGLDYGWGPTAFIEYLLEHVHIWTGTPWWASIVLSAFVVRLALFKLNVNAADQAGRLAKATPQLKPIQEKAAAARAIQDTQTMLALSGQAKAIMKAEGVSYLKLFGPVIQVPLGYGTFRLLQGMTRLPVPGLDDGGLLWIRDLTISDPFFTLPLATSLLMYFTFKDGQKGGETGASGTSSMSPGMRITFTYGLPMLSFCFMSFWPACVQLTFATTSVIAFGTSMLFRNPGTRAFLGISPLPTPPSMQPSTPYRGVMNVYQPPSSENAAPEKPKGVIGGAVADLKGAAKQVLGQARDMQDRKARSGGRLTPGELRRAKAYEEKRKRELETEKWEAGGRRGGGGR
ncbi:Mitochondrial inner membrane protein oxa1 [Lambiella insularis]|nr:Mitochondrial inner membrane protein oxa1 [Lambiella insularis]